MQNRVDFVFQKCIMTVSDEISLARSHFETDVKFQRRKRLLS